MNDQELDQDWTASYRRARARAAAAFGKPEDHEMVINTASAIATLELAEADMGITPTAREQADRESTDALLARLRATAPEAEAAAQSDPAPDHAQAALARAVASLNASRPVTPTATEAAADTRLAREDGATEAGSDSAHPDAVASAFKKAAASINAGR